MKSTSIIFTAILTLIVIIAPSSTVSAQTDKEEIEIFQALFGMEKKAIVSDFLKLDEQKGEAFWKLYDQYETERKALGQKRIKLIKHYAENYNSLTDEKIHELITDAMKQKSSLDNLINHYYRKIRIGSGSRVAGQFYQIEIYFLSAIRTSLFTSIPMIGELDK